jgi:hypothetical protein
MTPRKAHSVVIVPGLRGHVADHWQTHLAARLPEARIVESYRRAKSDLDGRVADLHHAIQDAAAPVTLVAHSAGCLVTAHWASRHDSTPVRAALLATPPDLAQPLPGDYPSLDELHAAGWMPIPRARLPFASIVAASTNDALGDYRRVHTLAAAWGSRVIDVGPVGHLNPASGYGDWPGADALLDLLHDTRPTPLPARKT